MKNSDLINENRTVKNFMTTVDKFTYHFNGYFYKTKNEGNAAPYLHAINLTARQIVAIFTLVKMQFDLLNENMKTIHTEKGTKFSWWEPIDTDSELVLIVKGQNLLVVSHLKSQLKAFFIFNKIFYDLLAEITVLAYLKKDGQIGKGYTSVFGLDKPPENCTLNHLDKNLYDKIAILNSKYNDEIRSIREDFVHKYSDISFIFNQDKAYYQIVSLEDAPKVVKDQSEKGALIPTSKIDEAFVLTSEIMRVLIENFNKEKRNKFS